jgi:hypothetical protein
MAIPIHSTGQQLRIIEYNKIMVKIDKAISLQAWTGPKGSRRLRLPDIPGSHFC